MRASLLTSSILLLVACGGDDKPTPGRGAVNSSNARSSITSVGDILGSMRDNDPSGAADGVMALTAAGQGVLVPTGARVSPAELPEHWPMRAKDRQALTGSASCTETDCVFDDFGDDTPYGSYRLDGSISRHGDRITFDLTWTITTAQVAFAWSMDGDITANDTLIDGEVHSHGESNGSTENGSYAVTWDLDIGYEHIGLDGSGCPVSGALDATVSLTSASSGGGGSWAAHGHATFGPTCGQVSLD